MDIQFIFAIRGLTIFHHLNIQYDWTVFISSSYNDIGLCRGGSTTGLIIGSIVVSYKFPRLPRPVKYQNTPWHLFVYHYLSQINFVSLTAINLQLNLDPQPMMGLTRSWTILKTLINNYKYSHNKPVLPKVEIANFVGSPLYIDILVNQSVLLNLTCFWH